MLTQKHKFEVGDRVKLMMGSLLTLLDSCEVFPIKDALSMVSIFGRDTRVEDLEFWQ